MILGDYAVHRWNSFSSALSALLFLVLMTSIRLKELLKTCSVKLVLFQRVFIKGWISSSTC